MLAFCLSLITIFIAYILPFILAKKLNKRHPNCAKECCWLGKFNFIGISIAILCAIIAYFNPPSGCEKPQIIVLLFAFGTIIFGWLWTFVTIIFWGLGLLVPCVIATYIYLFQQVSTPVLITRTLLFSWIITTIFSYIILFLGGC